MVSLGNRTIGFVVDSAREFLSIPTESIQPPNEAISGLSGKYLDGIATLEGRMILILNLDEVINVADIIGTDQHTGAAL